MESDVHLIVIAHPGETCTVNHSSQLFTMSSIHALSYQGPQRLFDDIDRSFQLSSQDLVELTKAFLHEISLGLASYNQPMAMMYVHSPFHRLTEGDRDYSLVRLSLRVCLMAQKQGMS